MLSSNREWPGSSSSSQIEDLRNLVGIELDFVKEYFVIARGNIDQVLVHISETHTEFDQLIKVFNDITGCGSSNGREEIVRQLLQQLRNKVGMLKASIPVKFLNPSKWSAHHLVGDSAGGISSGGDDNDVANMWRMAVQELNNLKKLYEAAQYRTYEVLGQIRDLDDLLKTRGEGGGGEASSSSSKSKSKESVLDVLRQLKLEVSYLKSQIPFSLINHPVGNQLPFNLRRIWAPWAARVGGETWREALIAYPELVNLDSPLPTFDELETSLRSLDEHGMNLLRFCMFFTDNVVAKKTVFSCWWEVRQISMWGGETFDGVMDRLIEKGFIEPVYKNSTSSIAGYQMHPFVQSNLDYTNYIWSDDTSYISPCPTTEGHVSYSDPQQILTKKKLKFLHFGMWHRLPQHIEVAEPNLFFQDMEGLSMLEYISFRGMSMIIELPQFITRLKKLRILDLKACHNLETIPHNIYELGQTLTHLDMSECYILDHMPRALSQLHSLRVLKGFFVGESSTQDSCTLSDLNKLVELRKLKIYTNLYRFPNMGHLKDLLWLLSLQSLTISWGGCQPHNPISTTPLVARDWSFSFMLHKLDLQCVPDTVTRVWLKPSSFRRLKKLYIRGGRFFDLGQRLGEPNDNMALQVVEEDQWTVEILRLKHLCGLKMDWTDVGRLFPKLLRLEKVYCPNLTSFPCDKNGMWVKSGYVCLSESDTLYEG